MRPQPRQTGIESRGFELFGLALATRFLTLSLLSLLMVMQLMTWGSTASLFAQQSAAEIFRNTSPSVVGLTNPEGSGTGVIISADGLILTNAHVVDSPLPYRCLVDILRNGKIETVTFQRVQLISRHPDQDLALVRINPAEHAGSLTPATFTRKGVSPGDQVFAIGNPAVGNEILNKTITQGLISGVDRLHEGVSYYQIDAAINPGNSGGPVLNNMGQVIGIATLKFTDVENVGFVLPVRDLQTRTFVAWENAAPNPRKAQEAINTANQLLREGEQRRRSSRGTPVVDFYRYLAFKSFHEAIRHDPTDWSTYYNCGLLLEKNESHEAATAYYTQALQIAPWGSSDDRVYRQLGLCLNESGESDKAAAVWKEGLTKFPNSGWCWELYSKAMNDVGNHDEAAIAAAAVIQIEPRNVDVRAMETILGSARRKNISADTNAKLRGMQGVLQAMQGAANQAQSTGVASMTDAFAEIIGQTTTAQKGELLPKFEAIDTDTFFLESASYHGGKPASALAKAGATSDSGSKSSDDGSISDFMKEDAERMANALLADAKAKRQSGATEDGNAILDELITKYPEATAAAEARTLLGRTSSRPSGTGTADTPQRIWTDRTGRFTIEATFIDRVEDTIRLRRSDGRILTIELEKLSDFDQRYLELNHPSGS